MLRKDPLDKLPGPKPFPIVGNVLQMDIGHLFVYLAELGNQYGGVFKIRFFTKPVVVVNDPQLIHEVLVTRSADFAGRPKTYLMKFVSEKYESIVMSDPTHEEKSRRKAVQKYLKQFGTGIQKIEEVTLTATNDLIHRFAEQNGHPTDFRDYLFHCVFDVMMIFLTGSTISKDEIDAVKNSMDTGTEAATAPNALLLDMFPCIRFLGNKTYRILMDNYQLKYELVSKWMENRPGDGFIHFIQSMSDEERQSSALDTELAQHNTVWLILATGIYTTSTTLSVLINVLCYYPDIQEKLRKEVMDVIGPSRQPTLKDRDSLPYLRATLIEIGRFASITPFAIPHKALQTSSIGQYTIPKDTEVFLMMRSCGMNRLLLNPSVSLMPKGS